MPKLSDRIQENRFIALFVGRSGTGKTVAEASFPKPIHFEDFDGRIGGAQVPWIDQTQITYDYYPPKEPGLVKKLNEHLEVYLNAAKLATAQTAVQLPKTHVTDSITNLTYSLLSAAIRLTHVKKTETGKDVKAGRWFDIIAVEGPEDYKLEATGTYDYLAFLKSIPIQNIIISAHYVDRYGKPKDDDGTVIDPYGESIVLGKKLSIRDKIGENIQTSFDHIFEFEREVDRYFVYFRSEIARTSFDWLPNGKQEWTKKNFYEFMMSFKPKGATAV